MPLISLVRPLNIKAAEMLSAKSLYSCVVICKH